VVTETILSAQAVVPLYSELAIQVIREKMPCGEPLTGNINWMYSPTDQAVVNACYIPAWGCADPWGCEFEVWIATWNPRSSTYLTNAWNTALVNEIGYWVWDKCFDRMPEHYITNPDGTRKEVLDPDFAQWITDVNTETRNRATALLYSSPNQ
jgi:hypothetical protein